MKRILLIILAIISILSAFVYFLSCLTPFIGANVWWPMGFLGLGFPLIFAGLLLLFFLWIIINRKVALILLVCILLGFNNISSVFAGHIKQKPFILTKQHNVVRIMGYNVRGFDNFDCTTDSASPNWHNRIRILDTISNQDADILCLQDFNEYYHSPNFPSNIQYFKDKLHFNYYYMLNSIVELPPWGLSKNGVAIFSKFPLKNIQDIRYSGKKTPEGFITADITINNITRRLFVTHLQSMWLYNNSGVPAKWENSEDASINYSNKNMFERLNYYLPYHALQADELKKEMNRSPYPVILSLDMNEVPSSYCYHHIKGNLNDVFLQKGFGFGRTYYKTSPTLRIDYFITDPSIEVMQYKKGNTIISDHYPQVMDVKW